MCVVCIGIVVVAVATAGNESGTGQSTNESTETKKSVIIRDNCICCNILGNKVYPGDENNKNTSV